LNVEVNIKAEAIAGFNTIYFKATSDFETMQVDLSSNLSVDAIEFENNKQVKYKRDGNAIFINPGRIVKQGEQAKITIRYSGTPQVGKRLPWDGGLEWTKDEAGNPWVVVACQGEGASVWWPCKEHQSDEPDSMSIRITVPDSLMDISNGRLREVQKLAGNKAQYHWFVSYPINNYNVTINVGAFEHFSDVHINGKDTLTLDYYVKKNNLDKAKEQFKQVNPMLTCFEKYFGNYPFYRDGYKLVETPYLGMEHQSCIAYGNEYKVGRTGNDYSGVGLTFDYIIIHESAHEWWGNNVTTKDIADMWVHEGFGNYAELLYVECMDGKEKALAFANALRKRIGNDKPIIGPYGVNREGSGDMYNKGALMLNTLRNIVYNDSIWFGIVKGLQQQFALKTITSADVEKYIAVNSHIYLQKVFDQYLRNKNIPVFEYEITSETPFKLHYRWVTDVDKFSMPLQVENGKKMWRLLPTNDWQDITLLGFAKETFKIRDDLFYVKVKDVKN
jgi:aminopeptidase N